MKLLRDTEGGGQGGRFQLCLRLALVMTVCAALYGWVLGCWHGQRLAGYVALKLPLVLILTAAITALFSWMLGRMLGVALSFGQVAVLGLRALTVASLLLAALAPVAALFTYAAHPPTTAARTAHNLLYLMHTGIVGACGLVGALALAPGLRRHSPSRRVARGVHAARIAAYALAGGEVAWALRPFVGSVYEPVAFLRADALQGNVYEFIFTDIVPHLSARARGKEDSR